MVPDYFTKALIKNKKELQTFENYAWPNKKVYIECIKVAKTEGPNNKIIATAIEWMAERKSRHCKYAVKQVRMNG